MIVNTSTRIGILHPGAMGISVAATLQNTGHRVFWVSDGRSQQTRERAAQHNLMDARSLTSLCHECPVIVSVCPPSAAEMVADAVITEGFSGIYLDANAIAPQTTIRMGNKMQDVGITFVDGGIIGGPAWEPEQTWLYLSGEAADKISSLFWAGPLETEVIGPEIGKASALKMCFAARTKGMTALLCAVLAAAEQLGVREALERDLARRDPELVPQTQLSVRRVTANAWRFAGEMEEIAATFDAVGLPDGFHNAAAELYRQLAPFKDAPDLPELDVVLAALVRDDDVSGRGQTVDRTLR